MSNPSLSLSHYDLDLDLQTLCKAEGCTESSYKNPYQEGAIVHSSSGLAGRRN